MAAIHVLLFYITVSFILMMAPIYGHEQQCFEILNGDVYIVGVFPYQHHNNTRENSRQILFFYASFIKRFAVKFNSLHQNGTAGYSRIGYALYHGRCEYRKNPLESMSGVNKSNILVLFANNKETLEEVGSNIIKQDIPIFLLEKEKMSTSNNNNNSHVTTPQYHHIRPQISIEADLFHEMLKRLNRRFRIVSVDDFYNTFIEKQFIPKLTQDKSLCFQYTKLGLNATTHMIDLKLRYDEKRIKGSEIIILFGRKNGIDVFLNHLKSSNITGKVLFIHSSWSLSLKYVKVFNKSFSNAVARAWFQENPYFDLEEEIYNSRNLTRLDSVLQTIYNVSDEETRLTTTDLLDFDRLLGLANTLKYVLHSLSELYGTSIDEIRKIIVQNNTQIPSQLTASIYNSTLDGLEDITVYDEKDKINFHRNLEDFLPEKSLTSCDTLNKRCKMKYKSEYKAIHVNKRTQLFQNTCVLCSFTDKQTTCERHYEHVPYFSAVAYVIYSMMCVGVVTSMTTGIIFYFFRNTPYVKASHQLMSLVQLFAHFLLFIAPAMFVAKPIEQLCTARPVIFGILFTFIMAMTLTKTQKLVYIFRSRIRVSRKHIQMSQTMEISLILLMMLVQACIAGLSYLMSPSRVLTFYDLRTNKYITKCDTEEEFLIQLIFGFLLAVMCMIQAFKARNLPENFNETKLIFVTMILCVIAVVICTPLRIYLPNPRDKVVIDVILLLSMNSILLLTMYGHKCWIIIFRPEQNTTSAFKQKLQIHHLKGMVPSHVNMNHRDSTFSTTFAIELMTSRSSMDNASFRSSQLSIQH